MRRRPVESSTLTSVGYSNATLTLELQFTSGKVYQYFAVPSAVHEQLMKAESKGSFFNASIKDVYACSRV